jgi:hypothetical protein
MRSSILSAVAFTVSLTSAAPTGTREFSPDNVYFPLANGFPNPSQEVLEEINRDAHGTLPNGGPPPSLSDAGATNLKLIALNELFEVAFFSELRYNLTNKVEGYDLGPESEYTLDVVNSIVAQEELHVLDANNALEHFNIEPIKPCKYSFPVSDFDSAIALAATFTDLVLGTLQDVNEIFARSEDFGLVRTVSSVIGNEAEQEGFFRSVQRKRPSAQPFATTATRDFAFTAIQEFTIPDSCPNINTIPLKTFKPLIVESKDLLPETQYIKFSFSKEDVGMYEVDSMKLVYINGLNKPIIKSLEDVQMMDDKVVFRAEFPYGEFVMDGMTIAAVTQGADEFAKADEVGEKTVFGPGVIELN